MTDTPTGPALTYTTSQDTDGVQRTVPIDRETLTDPRERALCKALLWHALKLVEEADRAAGGRP
ncbi:hypothetical protein ACWDBD_17170 [Streptomyces sp. NPDC001118]